MPVVKKIIVSISNSIIYSNTPFYAANNAESIAVLHDTISWT